MSLTYFPHLKHHVTAVQKTVTHLYLTSHTPLVRIDKIQQILHIIIHIIITCTKFQEGAKSAMGSEATEQSAPIMNNCVSLSSTVTWS